MTNKWPNLEKKVAGRKKYDLVGKKKEAVFF